MVLDVRSQPPVAQKTPHLTPGDLYRLDGTLETMKPTNEALSSSGDDGLRFGLAGCGSDSTSDSPEGRRNFVVVLVDDQGWNGRRWRWCPRLPVRSDYHETPHLEEFAAEGMRFSEAYAAAPVCAPSRYAIHLKDAGQVVPRPGGHELRSHRP